MSNYIPCSCSKEYPKDREYAREGGGSSGGGGGVGGGGGGGDISTMKPKPVCLYVQTCIFPCYLCSAASIFYGHGCKLHSKEIANVARERQLVETRLLNIDFLLAALGRNHKGKIFSTFGAVRIKIYENFINWMIYIYFLCFFPLPMLHLIGREMVGEERKIWNLLLCGGDCHSKYKQRWLKGVQVFISHSRNILCCQMEL